MMLIKVLFSALAKRESRVTHVRDHPYLPRGTFLLREAYGTDPGCDCRRVLIQVMWAERAAQVATINYTFEPTTPPFDDEPQVFLDPLNPQSDLSGALLSMFETMTESDRGYHGPLSPPRIRLAVAARQLADFRSRRCAATPRWGTRYDFVRTLIEMLDVKRFGRRRPEVVMPSRATLEHS